MINFQALNVLLDTLRKVDPRAPPVARVRALRPTLRVASDGSSAANDLHASVAGAPPRSTPPEFPLLVDAARGARPRDAASNARVAAQVLLSAGGAELERALRGSTGRLPVAPTVHGSAPLIGAPPPLPVVESDVGIDDRTAVARSVLGLAHALRAAVTQSGLFYESHLARWIADDFPQGELDREPQSATLPAAADDATSAESRVAIDAKSLRALALVANASEGSIAARGETSAASAPARSDATPLLRQQLDVLDTRQFAWVGELWPGQRTAIRFEEERRHPVAQEPSAASRTQVHAHIILELPALGTVGAEIAIVEGSVHLQITTDGPASTQRLHAARAELAEALAARALPAAEIAVFDAL